jgi:hypothetical protein
MTQKEYRNKMIINISKALLRTSRELKEPFTIISTKKDSTTNEFVVIVEASDNFHNKAISYL